MATTAWRRLGAFFLVIMLLCIGAVPSASASSALAPDSSALAAPQLASSAGGTVCRTLYHRVARGENLTRIAWRYGVTVRQLQQWNNIWNPDRIYAGSVLVVRKCAPAPHPKPQPKPDKEVCISCPPPPDPVPVPVPCAGWHVDFFNNVNLGGPVAYSTCTKAVAFNWGWDAPAPGVNADGFSVRFTNSMHLQKGTWRITVRSDDGIRLFIDDVLVIDDWRIQAPTTDYRDVMVAASGQHHFRVEYFENDQHAEVHVWCQKIG